jgi:hypothetical protein
MRLKRRPAAEAALPFCALCGRGVAVDDQSRCPLGHLVAAPPAPPVVEAPVVEPTAVALAPAPAAAVAQPDPAPSQPAAPAAPPASDDAFAHPFDDAFDWSPPGAAPVTASPAPAAQVAPTSAASAAPAAPTAPPAAPAPPGAVSHADPFDAFLDWDADAPSALDVDTLPLPQPVTPPPAPARTPVEPLFDDAGDDDDTRARLRAAGIVGGTLGTGLLLLGALQLAL